MGKTINLNSVEEAQEKLAELREQDPSINKPSEEEVNQAIADFNAKAAEFNGKKFEIGESDQAIKIFDFILDFMENHVYWTKNGWMGVLKMHEELTEAKEKHKEGEKFAIGYQALEFMFYALTNPGGTGLASAKAVEKVADWYAEVIEMSAKVLEAAREELKDIQFLQDRVTAMQQGFYLEREDGVAQAEEAMAGAFAAPTADDLLNPKEKTKKSEDKNNSEEDVQ